MNKQMSALMQRRGELVARIAVQRGQVAETAAQWRTPLAYADRGLAAIRFLRARPLLVASVVALVAYRRRGIIGLARAGLIAWKGYRYFTAVSASLSRP